MALEPKIERATYLVSRFSFLPLALTFFGAHAYHSDGNTEEANSARLTTEPSPELLLNSPSSDDKPIKTTVQPF